MNPPDHRLNRLLEAAQRACPPVPEISPWFETRVMAGLRAEALPLSGLFDAPFVFRILAGAALLMVVSVTLPLLQVKNPYLETMEMANTIQMENLP
jgi:hypothetical protein